MKYFGFILIYMYILRVKLNQKCFVVASFRGNILDIAKYQAEYELCMCKLGTVRGGEPYGLMLYH